MILLRLTRVVMVVSAALTLASAAAMAAEADFDVRRFGAVEGGKALSTAAIQRAVDEVAAAGGGTVVLPPGRWLSGTVRLRSRVTLLLEAGCTLVGSTDLKDYPEQRPAVRSYTDNYVTQSLIAGEGLEGVAIRGPGCIDGSGAAFRRKEYLARPYVIRLVGCRGVLVEGVTLRDSPMWMQHYLACEHVTIRGITVSNHVSYNNDGLDIDGCTDVSISDCRIDSDDDALCLKSTLDRPCRAVRIANCLLSSHCNALKMGTESNGGFQDITISNCVILAPRLSQPMYGKARGISGIALEIVDGGRLDGVAVSNIVIRGVTVPLFMRLGNRARPFAKDGPRPPVGTFRNVRISHVIATEAASVGCALAGIPGHPLQDVTLSDVRLVFEGGGKREDAARDVPEKEADYPEALMFGALPAYGLFARHVRGLKLSGVELAAEKADARPAIVCDDVEGLRLDGLEAAAWPGAPALVRLKDARSALLTGCRPQAPEGLFLRIEGAATRRIVLLPNDLSAAGRAVETAADVPAGAVIRGP